MTCATCQQRPATLSGRSAKCAECRKDTRRETEAVSRAIWGALWKDRRHD